MALRSSAAPADSRHRVQGTFANTGAGSVVRRSVRWHSLRMPRLTRRSAWFALATAALAVGALTERATSGNTVSFAHNAHPRVTNRCPVGALPLRRVDLAALRHFALELAPHGVKEAGSQDI